MAGASPHAGPTDMWAMADYGPLSERLAPAAELLISLLGPEPGDRLLDIAAGMGSATVVAVDRGATVTAIDASPAMVARGREQSAYLGGAVTWLEGDVEGLPVEDGSADSPAHAAVASMAGGRAPAMFAAVEDVFAPGGGPVDVDAGYLAVTARRPSTRDGSAS